MKAKKKLFLWIVAPLLLYTIVYSLWFPVLFSELLEYEAWKREQQEVAVDLKSTVLLSYLYFYQVYPLWIITLGGPIGLVVFILLAVGWGTYLIKLHKDYLKGK